MMPEEYLYHHGTKGMNWGVRHGPPYPLKRGVGGRILSKRKKKQAKPVEDASKKTDSNNEETSEQTAKNTPQKATSTKITNANQNARNMSDDELAKETLRIRNEINYIKNVNEYNQLVHVPTNKEKIAKYILKYADKAVDSYVNNKIKQLGVNTKPKNEQTKGSEKNDKQKQKNNTETKKKESVSRTEKMRAQKAEIDAEVDLEAAKERRTKWYNDHRKTTNSNINSATASSTQTNTNNVQNKANDTAKGKAQSRKYADKNANNFTTNALVVYGQDYIDIISDLERRR